MRVSLGCNLDDVKVGFEPLPVGTYDFMINDEPKVQPNKANDGMTLHVKATVINNEEYAGKKLMHFCSMKKDNLGMPTGLKAFMQACGAVWDEDGFDTMDLLGLCFTAVVIQEIAQSKDPVTGEMVDDLEAPPRNRIDSFVFPE